MHLLRRQCCQVNLGPFSEVKRQPGSWGSGHSAEGSRIAICTLVRRRIHRSLRADCHCLRFKRSDWSHLHLLPCPSPHWEKAAFPVARRCVPVASSALDGVPQSAGLVLKGPEKAFFHLGAEVSTILHVSHCHLRDYISSIDDIVLSDARWKNVAFKQNIFYQKEGWQCSTYRCTDTHNKSSLCLFHTY